VLLRSGEEALSGGYRGPLPQPQPGSEGSIARTAEKADKLPHDRYRISREVKSLNGSLLFLLPLRVPALRSKCSLISLIGRPTARNFRNLFGTLATRALSFPGLRCRASGRLHNRLKVGSFVSGMPIAHRSIPFSLSPRLSPATEAVNTLSSHPAWQRTVPLLMGISTRALTQSPWRSPYHAEFSRLRSS
jgi:hypothetical protein